MRYIFLILVLVIVIFLAYNLIPIAFALFRILIGLGAITLFALGFWVRGLFDKKSEE